MSDRSHVSPWSTDPISWVTTATIPVTATVLAVVYSVVEVIALPPRGGALQWLGILLLAASGAVVHLRTRPPRGVLGTPEIVAVLGLLSAATLCSALDHQGVAFSITFWWAPFGVSLVLVAMAPYVRASSIAALAVALVGVFSLIAVVLIVPDDPSWPPVTTALIVATPVVAGGTVSAVLSGSIVRRLMRWSERPLPAAPAIGPEGIDDRALVRAVDDEISEQLAAAVTFLRTVARRGEVTDRDARQARSLSLELRARLIADASATWLERVVRGHPVDLDDPERLADRLSVSQRTALRAMIDALLAHPESGFVSASISLRGSVSGDVAVAMRINTTLPEGRRISFLAPYYVSLSSAVRDIQWRDGATLMVEFEAPAETTAGRAPLVQRTPRSETAGERD